MVAFDMTKSKWITFTAFVAILVAFWPPAYSADLQVPHISKGACPFEGCSYGKWPVLKKIAIYEKPDKTSSVVHVLQPGENVNVVTGNVHVVPGRAKIIGKPHKSAKNLDPTKEVFILDYLGEGYSRVFQDGHFDSVKIARSMNECRDKSNWRYCWVEVLLEPTSHWWVFVRTLDGKHEGWVLMEGGALKATDTLSKQRVPANTSMHLTGFACK